MAPAKPTTFAPAAAATTKAAPELEADSTKNAQKSGKGKSKGKKGSWFGFPYGGKSGGNQKGYKGKSKHKGKKGGKGKNKGKHQKGNQFFFLQKKPHIFASKKSKRTIPKRIVRPNINIHM